MRGNRVPLILPLTLAALALALVALAAPGYSDGPVMSWSSQASPSAGLTGTIRDANSGQGLPGLVYLYDAGDPNVEHIARGNLAGMYGITVPAGTYDVYAAMVGYERVDGQVAISSEGPVRLDFDLPAPILGWTPYVLSETIDPGETTELVLTVSNAGSSDLQVRVYEVADGVDLAAVAQIESTPAGSGLSGIDPQVYADLAASADGTAEILVVMAEQADLSAAHHISDWSARGHYVYDTLKATAERSQTPVRQYLEENEIAYRSHLSLNSLTLVASRTTVDGLATLPDVGAIRPATVYDLPLPTLEPAASLHYVDWNVRKVQADQVWDPEGFGVTGEGIVVANIDTGVDWEHPALRGQYRGWDGITATHGYNWWDPRAVCPPGGAPCDNHWHGTHTMGTIVGSDRPDDALNAPNAIGLAPGARWIACKGCEMAGEWLCSTFALLECADFVLAPWDQDGQNPNPGLRPHVVNNSWGGEINDGWYFGVIAAWRAAGIFPAFSAGNDGASGCRTITSPADYSNAFATGATDGSDNLAGFSSRGPSRLGVLKPDVTAPGVSVRSGMPDFFPTYWKATGTSMASPHTAGEVALIWSAQPQLVGQVQMTEWLIRQTADGMTTPEQCGGVSGNLIPNNSFGWGRINAHRAVSEALSMEWDVGWLEVSPTSATVGPGQTIALDVTLDSRGLAPNACVTAQLKLETNDPYRGLDSVVPVELCVTPEKPLPGLYLTKTVVPEHQMPGGPVTYTLVFGNESANDVPDVVVTDVLPSEIHLVWISPTGDLADSSRLGPNASLVWGPMTLTVGSRFTVTVAASLRKETPYCLRMNSTAYLVSKGKVPLTATAGHSTPCFVYFPAIYRTGNSH